MLLSWMTGLDSYQSPGIDSRGCEGYFRLQKVLWLGPQASLLSFFGLASSKFVLKLWLSSLQCIQSCMGWAGIWRLFS